MKYEEDLTGKAIALVIGIVAIAIVLLFFSPIAIVPAGTIGIQDTFGNVSEQGLTPGISLKSPITNVIPMSTQTQKYNATARAASSDLQDVSTEITLNYHLNANTIPTVYKNLGLSYQDKVIVPAVQESVKASTARFTAEELITKRPEVKEAIDKALATKLQIYNITIETVSITDFKFSEQFTQAIEAKVTAQQEALKAENDLRRIEVEKQQQITKSEADAKTTTLNADAQAYAKRVNADAEAYSLEVIRKQLENQPNLIQYNAVNKWNGTLPTFTGAGAIPFIDITKQ